MDAMNVTDVFKIETQAKLAASDDHHKTALDCGLVQFHCQGYKDGWYQETCEALNTAVKSMDADSDDLDLDLDLDLDSFIKRAKRASSEWRSGR